MAGTILPLPIMIEEDQARKQQEQAPPATRSLVVRYGYMKMIAELPFSGDQKFGCGTKLVIRTTRGMELADMLTTTCPNGGCGMAVTRKQMLQYIDQSGGKDYPFVNQGRVLRVATVEDMTEQARLDSRQREIIRLSKQVIAEMRLPMRLVEVELLLGGERIIFHYTSEQWIDFRELVKRLATEYQTRIEMHQVNARDEARLVADYEKCGQQCCCKQFLKVLKPVSMKAAKTQKATLDPTKISGRCGRLMCCLRYEEETYDSLRKKLPRRQSRWMTTEGIGTVLDTQILTQLALIRLDKDGAVSAYPVESLREPTAEELAVQPPPPREAPAPRGSGPVRRDSGPGAATGRDGPRGGPGSGPRGNAGPSSRGPSQGPRRPTPGAPLQQDEVESREGPPMEEDVLEALDSSANEVNPATEQERPRAAAPRERAADAPVSAGARADDRAPNTGPNEETAPGAAGAGEGDEEQGEDDAGPGDGTTGEGGSPQGGGEPGGGRRRRRRRRRGRGGRGGGGGGEGQGPPPAAS